ncbi:hypothetical protein H5410_002074 [Solanum commersonii]|uniref:Uncharacterized protein n=1 Tax=Solanum commersonii TaxID=4109 RepID=A0A9J6B0M1_SOLCO|nr:hypothetical protein H5410_002074 [Solanum commersonii]
MNFMILECLNGVKVKSSCEYENQLAATESVKVEEETTGLLRGKFPFILYWLSYRACQKKENDFGRLLSFGGKVVLINHVLQSLPIYLLSVMTPPKCIIYDIHRIFANFLWNFKWKEEKSSGHYLPNFGGISGPRSLYGLISYGTSIAKDTP